MQRDTTGLTSENKELKLRLQALEQQAHLRDGMHKVDFYASFCFLPHVLVKNLCAPLTNVYCCYISSFTWALRALEVRPPMIFCGV